MTNKALSSVAKKLLTGMTGLALVSFLIVHLIGNLTIYAGPEMFNAYAHFLHHFMHGLFVWFARAGLLAFFLVHIYAGISVQLSRKKARPAGYAVSGNAGGASKKSKSSLLMMVSGLILLAFVIVHLNHFTIGAQKEVWKVAPDGHNMYNVYKLVVDGFQGAPLYVAFYVLAMLVLCSHLMHGLWSAFQSLGWTRANTIPMLHSVSVVFAIVLALGFLLLPVLIAALPGVFDANAVPAVHGEAHSTLLQFLPFIG